MSIAIVRTRAIAALTAPGVTVEVHLSGGLPAYNLVGLPETAVRESKDRVRSAILNSGFDFPMQRLTINLAPADLPKDGGRFDLAIALGILAASGQVPAEQLERHEFIGELALTGELRPVRGALISALACQGDHRHLVLPTANGAEARLASGEQHGVAGSLKDVCQFLKSRQALPASAQQMDAQTRPPLPDLADVRGQHAGRRALEIAAAGGHNLLYEGPPGCGKSMLAQRLPGILPPMDTTEAMEQLAIRSVLSPCLEDTGWRQRPYRAPHHSASAVALVGGGNPPRPGEISLAHHGVLFLDELPEFQRHVLESLREPLENGHVTISRASRQAWFPARFQLIAAMNPCPCGHWGDPSRQCRCTPDQIQRYRSRVSGPLLDRIDLHVCLQPTPLGLLCQPGSKGGEESSAETAARVQAARERQSQRQGQVNAALAGSALHAHVAIEKPALELLQQLAGKLGLSARSFERALRVARTIADLQGELTVQTAHVMEACSYRQSRSA